MTGSNTPPNDENHGTHSSEIEADKWIHEYVKLRVPISLHGVKSLRNIAPDHWRFKGKTLLVRSVIASYGAGPIEKKIAADVAQFIKENCRSARRLRTMSISAYESFASQCILPSYVSIGAMTFIALTAGVSTLDALACVLWGTVFGEAPKNEKSIPSMTELRTKLSKGKHPLHDQVAHLLESDWCKKLFEARNRVVHRGFWPAVEKSGDFVLCQELESFEFGGRTGPRPMKERPLDLVTIMHGLLCELEAWDVGLESTLKAEARFVPYVVGAKELQSTIDGQAECDWSIGCEVEYQNPTEEFMEEWKEHQRKTGTNSPESDENR
jgi:hypothetical protein